MEEEGLEGNEKRRRRKRREDGNKGSYWLFTYINVCILAPILVCVCAREREHVCNTTIPIGVAKSENNIFKNRNPGKDETGAKRKKKKIERKGKIDLHDFGCDRLPCT